MRRFYALHGMAVGQVVGWQPEGAAEVAPAPNPNPDPSPSPGPNPKPNPKSKPNPKPNPNPDQDEPALWRIAMADGDLEDLEEAELTDALQAIPSPGPSPSLNPNPNPNPTLQAALLCCRHLLEATPFLPLVLRLVAPSALGPAPH